MMVVYCCLVFLLVDLLIGVSSAVVRALVGLELEAPSDEPYLSTSLQDFWGRRWNLIVTNTLRHTVYKPRAIILSDFLGRQQGPTAGGVGVFCRVWSHARAFILLCHAWESILGNDVVFRPARVSTSFWLFFPPLVKNGADVTVIEEFKFFLECMKMNLEFPKLVGQ
ncbi:unnamed protein product [Ilex paraguariensis]|uniref:Wax synthase domain-containing protein n=1 Tax=Ilex paraguariensis TaxID=185542 RepID=A0ABC8TBI4_9AQUA